MTDQLKSHYFPTSAMGRKRPEWVEAKPARKSQGLAGMGGSARSLFVGHAMKKFQYNPGTPITFVALLKITLTYCHVNTFRFFCLRLPSLDFPR